MRFYHSVVIKFKKDDLLEVLSLNQIVLKVDYLCLEAVFHQLPMILLLLVLKFVELQSV